MANPRSLFVSKHTRHLLSSTSRHLFYYTTCSSWNVQPPYFSRRSPTRPKLIVNDNFVSCEVLARHSYSIEDRTKSKNFPKFGLLATLEYDPGRWICRLQNSGLEFKSIEHVLDKYVKLLAPVVGGSEYEAKKRIYFVSHGLWDKFGFGAEINRWQAAKLRTSPDISDVCKDLYVDLRNNCEYSVPKFSPLNWNNRLLNMFDYYNSNSECNDIATTDAEDSGHWLINITEPDGGPDEVDDYCLQLLTEFLGSEEEAIKKMYVVWSNGPYGFGAEMDKETSMKLQDHPSVLQVLQDNSFDIKDKNRGILYIYHWEDCAEPLIKYYPTPYTYEDDSDLSASAGDEDTAA